MKKLLFSLIILVLISACNMNEGYTIEGSLTGEVENGTQVFLRKVGDDNQPVDLDTTTVENGKYVFTGNKVESPEMRYIFVDKVQGYIPIILENGDISIVAEKDSLGFAKAKGAPQNDIFASYMDKSKAVNKRAMSIQEDLQKATMERNETLIVSLTDEMKELQEEYKQFDLGFVKDNPTALISVLLLERAVMSRSIPASEVKTLFDALSPEIKQTSAAKKVSEQITTALDREENGKNSEVGSKAPDFVAPTPTGTELALKDVLGKVTLIDFWAAWCKPCRDENPNVVNAYNKYHDKGFNIIGVSLDKSADAWKKAIEDDGLVWNHVSHISYFDDPIAKLYNVDAIPAAFLLDENGIIVAKNLRGTALEAKVGELLD